MRLKFLFKIDIRGWSSAKGELLVGRFERLLQRTLRDLPGQAMLVFLAVEGKGKTNEGKKKLDRNYLTSMILEVMKESLDGMFSTIENSNQALNLLIDSGMVPDPIEMKPDTDSIYIRYNTNEELRELIKILEDSGVQQQRGTGGSRPSYFLAINLMDKEKPPTSLTLKV